MDNKEFWYQYNKQLYDEGILKDVFVGERMVVCNVSDYFYALFYYSMAEYAYNNNTVVSGITVRSDLVPDIVANEELYTRSMTRLTKEQIEKISVSLTEKNIATLRSRLQESKINGPFPRIDKEMEQKLLGKRK